jgi:2-phospho-L-lactate guanylyltransferase
MTRHAPTTTVHGSGSWDVVIPLKALSQAKSRLELGALRPMLALAMARDTIDAVAACGAVGRIIVVTSDPSIRQSLPHGATVLRDPGGGLNSAVRAGIAAGRCPSLRHGIAIVTGDLPCARPAEWTTAFRLADRHEASFVPDTTRTGTTAFFIRADSTCLPRFGACSRRAHLALGAAELSHSTFLTIHRDVDTLHDFHEALALGVGRHTRVLVRAHHGELV